MHPPTEQAIIETTEKLRRILPNTDRFYPRWRIFASRHNIEI